MSKLKDIEYKIYKHKSDLNFNERKIYRILANTGYSYPLILTQKISIKLKLN